jgi:hypothetical protein
VADIESRLGLEHPTIVRVLAAYADHHRRGKQWNDAESLNTRAAAVAERAYGSTSSRYANVLAAWARTLKERGARDEARRLDCWADSIRKQRPLGQPGLMSIDVSAFR